jgi:hypothetical protein
LSKLALKLMRGREVGVLRSTQVVQQRQEILLTEALLCRRNYAHLGLQISHIGNYLLSQLRNTAAATAEAPKPQLAEDFVHPSLTA